MKAQEAYAVLSEDNTKLTFYYDNQKEARNGMSVSGITTTSSRGWHNQRTTIQKVEFDSSFDACHSLTTTRYWFCEFNNLTEITGIGYLHTENVTDMRGMFKACYKLKSIDVSGFNTEKVQSMYDMFGSCYKIESLNVSNFNTSNVTTMYRMFSSCENLKSIDVSNFNTENVVNMSGMFGFCKALTSLDISGFNTSKVTLMEEMFRNCTNLKYLTLGNFSTVSATGFDSMFENCERLTSLDVSNFKTDNAKSMKNMFCGCSSLESINVSEFNTFQVESMEYMFLRCSNISSLDLSSFNTSAVRNMTGMFNNCAELTTIYASDGWNTQSEQFGNPMFTDCKKLVGGQGNKYDSNHTRVDYARIDGGETDPGYLTYKAASSIQDVTMNLQNSTSCYNLSGQRLTSPQKGINIINGKKVMVK